jgi:hypothetical protein
MENANGAAALNLHSQPMINDSPYFAMEFNTAIIDGPLRIYFSDTQENEALQFYFEIQELLSYSGIKLNRIHCEGGNTFVMLYPHEESFTLAFGNGGEPSLGRFGEHQIIGIKNPLTDDLRKKVGQQIKMALENISAD